MVTTWEAKDWGELRLLSRHIFREGTSVRVRGRMTKEIEDVVIKLDSTFDHQTKDRSSIKDFKLANKRLVHIQHKVEFEINQCIELLSSDLTSRRARILEADYHPHNIACIQSVQFIVRDGQLNSKLFLRSSDVHNVLPLDIYATKELQSMVLKKIKTPTLEPITMGPMSIFISSAHVYEDDSW